jgi:hypothetical protein
LQIETEIGLRQREDEVRGRTQQYGHEHEYEGVTPKS